MNHYCDIWFWRASDQAEVARHLRDRDRTTGVPDTPRRAGPVRVGLRSILRMTGLAKQALEARQVEYEETPYERAVTVAVRRSSSTGKPYSTMESGFYDAPSADTSIACTGSQRTPGLSCWDWRGGDGGCR